MVAGLLTVEVNTMISNLGPYPDEITFLILALIWLLLWAIPALISRKKSVVFIMSAVPVILLAIGLHGLLQTELLAIVEMILGAVLYAIFTYKTEQKEVLVE